MKDYVLSEKQQYVLQYLFFILLLGGGSAIFIFGMHVPELTVLQDSTPENVSATSAEEVSNTYQYSSRGMVMVYGSCKKGEICLTSKGMALIY